MQKAVLFILCFGLLCVGAAMAGGAQCSETVGTSCAVSKLKAKASFSKLPLSFIKNEGQKDKAVLFYEQGNGHVTAFTRDGISLSLARSEKTKERKGASAMITLTPLNASSFTVEALDKKEGKVNYFIGNDPKNWKTDISTYGAILFKGVYSGIDMKFYGSDSQLEYDIIISPHGDPSKVRLSYKGIEKLSLTPEGDLEITLKEGSIFQKKPFIYQTIEGEKRPVQGKFVLLDKTTYGFDIGSYDSTRPLVVDPSLVYSTYLGGSNNDSANAIAVDSSGNVYVAGATLSSDFPTKSPYQATLAGGVNLGDAFIAKIGPSGNTLLYATYLGGTSDDYVADMAVDSSGNVYVAGATLSLNFPVKNAYQALYGGGITVGDAFIAKIGPSGNTLLYSTYLGGASDDYAAGIAVDSSGNVYVAGATASTNFPTKNAYQATFSGGMRDAFIAKIGPSGNTLLYSTYLGGAGQDYGTAIALDSSLNAYVAGYTFSTDFPTKNAYQSANMGGQDAFIAKIGPSGNTLLYSTYLGGASQDFVVAIALDSSLNAYVAGYTFSTDFPTKNAYQSANMGGQDAFIAKIGPSGNTLVYSTYLGGSNNDSATAIALDSSLNAYVAGYTFSTDFPTKNAYQSANMGGQDAFIVKLGSLGNALIYSTYLGGSNYDSANAIAVDAAGNAYVAGYTLSTDFPTYNPYQGAFAGGLRDGFITKLTVPPANFTLSISKTGAGSGTVTSSPSGISCGFTCYANFTQSTVVTLTATANSGSTFVSWKGCDSATGNVCKITMNADKTANVTFTLNTETLTVTKVGAGTGTISARGLSCTGNSCSGKYPYNTAIAITATPATGSTFTGWTGCDKTSGQTCTVAMTSDKAITATFIDANICTYALSPTSKPFGYGAAFVRVSVTGAGAAGCSNPNISPSDTWIGAALVSFKNNKGTVSVTVTKNTLIAPRSGTVTIGDATFGVTQAGAPCTIAVSPARNILTSSAQSATFAVSSPAGCAWAAEVSSGSSWLSISSGTGGSGNGSVTYQVAEKTTRAMRTGTIKTYITDTPRTNKVFTATQR